MNNWKNCKIKDLGEVVGGGTPSTTVPDYWGGNIAWITPKDMSQQSNIKYISSGERYITAKGLSNSSSKLLPKETVLFTSRAPIGYIGIATQNITTNQGFKSIVVNDSNSNEFVYYLLKHSVDKIIGMAGGSTFKEINGSTFKEIEIKVPPLPTQRRIAAILSALDDKIENNRKICETLEQIAQSIFKRWFVDDKDESWEEKNLNDVAVVTMGQSPPSSTYNQDNEGLPFFQGSKEFGWRKPTIDKWCNEPKRIAEQGDILISVRAPVGDMNIAAEKCCIGRGLASVRGDSIPTSVLFYALKNGIQQIKNFASGGSVFDSLNKNTLAEVKISIPPFEMQKKIFDPIDSIFNSINKYDEENQILQQTRDTLLPKLMGGEVEV
ncbi:MAG: restriction endonuclease subunit S [Candidatus Neomarinimicrobiota bacterium]